MPPPKKEPKKVAKGKPITRALLGSTVVSASGVTANAGTSKQVCTFLVTLESPMGPECGGTRQRFEFDATISSKIGPTGNG